MKLPKLFDLQNKLTGHDKTILLLRFTIVGIISYAMGAMLHSELIHFFLGDY